MREFGLTSILESVIELREEHLIAIVSREGPVILVPVRSMDCNLGQLSAKSYKYNLKIKL